MVPVSFLFVSLLVFVSISNSVSFSIPSRHISRRFLSVDARKTCLGARVARKEEEQEKASASDMVTIPFDGLVGRDQGSLFDRPLDVFDPIKDTDSLPGADGSDEKIAAIQARISDRVAAMRQAGQWDDGGDAFGKDPGRWRPARVGFRRSVSPESISSTHAEWRTVPCRSVPADHCPESRGQTPEAPQSGVRPHQSRYWRPSMNDQAGATSPDRPAAP